MNQEPTYLRFNLAKEMLETPQILVQVNTKVAQEWATNLAQEWATGRYSRILLTGEGSSRIFPGKFGLYEEHRKPTSLPVFTDGATQAGDYDLSKTLVIGASNSGKTRELIRLFKDLKARGHLGLFGITATPNSLLTQVSRSFVLGCGEEKAVAATKSVVEQAWIMQIGLQVLASGKTDKESIRNLLESFSTKAQELSQHLTTALEMPVPQEWIQALSQAQKIYFAGRSTGVAEELALKTNEITRKDSAYLEGTLAVHGIEEVMDAGDALIIIDPFEAEEENFQTYLQQGVGIFVGAISSRQTRFPTMVLPALKDFSEIVQLAAGWNLLLEVGLAGGIDVDTPVRARKVGNEFKPQ
jgi:glucosamine--fructose-6-phosphate aminotransferase (isomerizing)